MLLEEKKYYEDMPLEAYDTKKGKDPYIFVSYSRSNQAYVKMALSHLIDEEEGNFRIWYDAKLQSEGEADFEKVLKKRIEESCIVLLFISAESMSSKWVGKEILEAYKQGKELRCFALLEDDHIDNSEREVESLIPEVLKSYIIDKNQIIKYEMKQEIEEDKSDSWNEAIADLIKILPYETRQAVVYEDDNKTIIKDCKNDKKIIPLLDSVTTIRAEAFKDREELSQINLNQVKKIEDNAFDGCSSLMEIYLPDSIQYLGEDVFKDCESLADIKFGSEISFLGEGMFDGCTSLKTVELPTKLIDIPTGLFNGCSSLMTVIFPNELKTIGESAFENCDKLSFGHGKLSEELRIIDDQAFASCDNLRKVYLPSKLVKLGKNVFRDCINLEEVFIDKDVSYIGASPFRGCQNLKKILVSDRSKFFRSTESDGKSGEVLYNKNRSDLICYPAGINEKSYQIPDSVMTICEWAFAYSQLEHIEISDSVDIIKENAFFKCKNLREIRLPDGVTILDNMAFRKCENLETVFIPSSVTKIGYAVFSGCHKVKVICESEDSLGYKVFSELSSVECICDSKEFNI